MEAEQKECVEKGAEVYAKVLVAHPATNYFSFVPGNACKFDAVKTCIWRMAI